MPHTAEYDVERLWPQSKTRERARFEYIYIVFVFTSRILRQQSPHIYSRIRRSAQQMLRPIHESVHIQNNGIQRDQYQYYIIW